jgi:hypothetical protein
MVCKKEEWERERARERKAGFKIYLQGHTLNDLLPPNRSQFLKFLPPLKSSLSYEFINGLILYVRAIVI